MGFPSKCSFLTAKNAKSPVFKTYHLRKANQVARAVLERRGRVFEGIEENILKAVFEQTEAHRSAF